MVMHIIKRTFFGFAAAVALLLGAGTTAAQAQENTWEVGIQTWTLRKLNFDQVVQFCVEHKIKDLQVIGSHIDPMGTPEETKRKLDILQKNGLRAYTFGVAGTSLDKAQNRKLFEFAKAIGAKLIVVEPPDFRILDQLEELVKEFDIRIAIHNHGIKSLYGNPLVVRTVLKGRDPRMGVCLDIGWVTAAGFDAAKVFNEYEGRVFDLHLKDKRVEKTAGDDVAFDTNIGEGQANYKGLFAALKQAKFQGILAIETDGENFATKPGEFVDKAKQYVDANR